MLDLAKFPLPWHLESTRREGLVPKIVAANGRTILCANWAMIQDLSTEEHDQLWDALKGMVLAGNQKNKQMQDALAEMKADTSYEAPQEGLSGKGS